MKVIRILLISVVIILAVTACQDTKTSDQSKNLALVATPSGSVPWGPWVGAMNDGLTPADSIPWRPRGRRGRQSAHWVQYDWIKPVTTGKIAVYLWDYYNVIPLPASYRILYWNGTEFAPVTNVSGLEMANNSFTTITFDEIETTKLKLEVDSSLFFIANVLEWEVYQADNSPDHPPVISAGGDRDVMLGGKTYLSGAVKSVTPVDKVAWKTVSVPGKVVFEKPDSINSTASFSEIGEYLVTLTVTEGRLKSIDSLKVIVHQPPQEKRLDVVYTERYKIDSPLWNKRAKALIVNWIPHCIDQINRTDLKEGQGGIDNFIEAAKALNGKPHGRHLGYVFSNAWVHQTIESMCIALMVDPQGDKEIIEAQKRMKATLEDWIPKILAAQEPDGYLQTAYTLRDTNRWKERWSPDNRDTHEGYVAGYFIESAINHYTLTEGTDTRLYNAAKKLADCWVANIGPGKKEWFDGHQEMEQALVRFGRFVNDMEGNGRGDSYIVLAKYLLDCRANGSEYDQSHVPVQQQYEAVGHAVRAVYNYSGMADIAAETANLDYQSAVMSLWNNMVNKKYYVTGGIGSGETSEGFGPNYSLPNDAYCESCSSCGLIFFQYKMNLAYHDAKYADLYEETMYNALLGSIDLEGKNFYYDNPLSSSWPRYDWHVCPCCVGNIPRTLLMVPTWTYVKSDNGIYVNLFIGSTIKVENVAGTDVEMVQKTDYPWSGKVVITVNPKQNSDFTVYVRVPNRSTSALYTPDHLVSGLKSISVNGEPVEVKTDRGYMAITRTWKSGDRIEFEMPMEIQKITADERIEADRGNVSLRYGPLIYSVETADQPDINGSLGTAPLSLEWKDNLLDGVMTIKGSWADGTPLLAIPYFVRNNRIPETYEPGEHEIPTSLVWFNK
jgi:uncharacterized protein